MYPKPNQIDVTKTWFNDILPVSLSSFYSVFRNDRNMNGGRVMILLNSSVIAILVDNVNSKIEDVGVHFVWAKIIFVLVLYIDHCMMMKFI